MKSLPTEENFLGISEPEFFNYESSKVVIQQVPYEYTSSYLQGSKFGPKAMVEASHFVEFYDEETDSEAFKNFGIATMPELDFTDLTDEAAINYIESETSTHLDNNKFVVSFGAEHTVTLGFVKALKKQHTEFTLLQIDAHSDLRLEYHDNPYSHASVMARVHELGVPLCQIGIRAQCKQEADLIKSSPIINTWYAHMLDRDDKWMDACIEKLGEKVYISIDADGFDPSVMPAVGTAEPGGLEWGQGLRFLKKVVKARKIIGFDIVECAPKEGEILTQFNCAKLAYKILCYINSENGFQ
ncbi:MAG: agmatinase [Bacteroidia bacterium]|nr:agmatinase [Bacteroidia bacterium]